MGTGHRLGVRFWTTGCKDSLEGVRQRVEPDRECEKLGVSQVAARTGAEPSVELLVECTTTPGRLALKGAERGEVALGSENTLDLFSTGRPNQLVLEVIDAYEEAELCEIGSTLR